jgi:two-component system OmpR family sensor kinase
VINSLRTRLALWFAFTLVIATTVLGWFVYLYVDRSSRARIDEGLVNVSTAFVQLWRSARLGKTARAADEILSEARADDFEFVVVDDSQQEIVSNSRVARLRRTTRLEPGERQPPDSLLLRPDLAPLFRRAGAEGEAFATLNGPLGRERAYAVAITMPGRREIVAVIQGLEGERAMLRALRHSVYWSMPIGLLVAFLGGTFLAGRALRPVGEMADQAGRIQAQTLHERLPVSNPDDELGHLSSEFNHLLDRLETAFEQQRRFMAEASHELRTPIAVIRGEADLALSKEKRGRDEYREALTVIGAESRRMTRVVEDLFLLARADAGQLQLTVTGFDLGALAATTVRSAQVMAAARSLNVRTRVEGDIPVRADEALVGRLIRNLLDNAIKYGRQGGAIEVEVSAPDGVPTVAIRDDGPGIPAEIQRRIFDRFYRGPESRAADAAGDGGGAGLGLAIARGIAEAHRGTLVLQHSGPDGTEFRLTLPSG